MNEKLTKNERREQAREQARRAREAEKKREKRNRWLLQGGIVVVVVAILGVVALVLSQSMKPAGPGPANMISGGVTFGSDLEVVKTASLQEARSVRPATSTGRSRPSTSPSTSTTCAPPAATSSSRTAPCSSSTSAAATST